jgi:DNA-binding CsgD family transcriptional regulator
MSEVLSAVARVTCFFHRCRASLRTFLTREGTVGNADLDDFAQEVFVWLIRYDRAELIQHAQAFLYNVAAEWASRAPCDAVARERMRESVEDALNTLTLRQRQVLKLQFHEGLEMAETAKRLGMTQRSVKQSVVNSYDKLRQGLDAQSVGRVIGSGKSAASARSSYQCIPFEFPHVRDRIAR